MNVLIACEESQVVCKAFRDLGANAFSCDILSCSGGFPEWHIQNDVLKVINPSFYESDLFYGVRFYTCDGVPHSISGKWDLIIAHPPCTYLTVTGNRWFNVNRYGDKALQRIKLRSSSIDFFMSIANANCDKIVIENPIGVMSTIWRRPDQIIQPYFYGDPYEKKTCLWLKGVSPLLSTNIVQPEERIIFKSGKTMPKWYAELWSYPKEFRSRIRSRTFPGFASAMASQWYN